MRIRTQTNNQTTSVAVLWSFGLDLFGFDGTAQKTSPAGGDETDFLTRNSLSGDGGCLSDMLMITTTVRMVHGIHSNTTSTGPAGISSDARVSSSKTGEERKEKKDALVALCLELVIRSSGFQQWLVDSSTTSDNPNRSSSITRDRLLRTTRQSDTSLVLLGGMSDDGSVVP